MSPTSSPAIEKKLRPENRFTAEDRKMNKNSTVLDRPVILFQEKNVPVRYHPIVADVFKIRVLHLS
jgi:hypothetical protein